jgi:hypothetical protein
MDFFLVALGMYVLSLVANYYARRLGTYLNGGPESKIDSLLISTIISTAILFLSLAVVGFVTVIGVW